MSTDDDATGQGMWVVDLETTGLDERRHVPVEVAAVNVATGEAITFVPHLNPRALATADPYAMHVNRYFERGLFNFALTPEQTANQYRDLFRRLAGQRFGGANARFDALMLRHALGSWTHDGSSMSVGLPSRGRPAEETWHYRLSELGSYVGGVLGHDPADPLGLAEACRLLQVPLNADDEHTALGDARAAAECFRRAHAIVTERQRSGT